MFDETLLLNQSNKVNQAAQNIITKDNDSEYDSKQDFLFHSVGTGSFNSACQSNENSFITGNFITENTNNKKEDAENVYLENSNSNSKNNDKNVSDKTNTKSKSNNLNTHMNDESSTLQNANANNPTIRGDRSSCNPAQMDDEDDSISILSEKRKKVIVRIVTIFSVIFFLICFAMIAFTLRMSEKIDAQSKFLKPIKENFSYLILKIYLVSYHLKKYERNLRELIQTYMPC